MCKPVATYPSYNRNILTDSTYEQIIYTCTLYFVRCLGFAEIACLLEIISGKMEMDKRTKRSQDTFHTHLHRIFAVAVASKSREGGQDAGIKRVAHCPNAAFIKQQAGTTLSQLYHLYISHLKNIVHVFYFWMERHKQASQLCKIKKEFRKAMCQSKKISKGIIAFFHWKFMLNLNTNICYGIKPSTTPNPTTRSVEIYK